MAMATYRPRSRIAASRLEPSLSAPPGSGHYTLKRISYISELPGPESFAPRPRSILRSASFTMGLGFKDKEKGKERAKDRSKVAAPTPPLASTSVKDKPTTSHGLFSSLTKSKGLKKKRSLSSLLDESSSTSPSARPSAPPATRARSSDAASTLSSVPTVSKEKQLSPEKQRLEECRQMHLRPLPPKPIRSKPKNRWQKRFNMRIHRDYSACYMQAYDSIPLENDRQTGLLLRRLNPLPNPSFYDFTGEEPLSVLDLGCGAGHWVLEAANYWKQAIVTGVDIVDIFLPQARDHHQIDFVQGNFLIIPWPFQDKSFDFVRLANLSLCIPYDKWEPILSEIHRVLRINGRFELIDDQIIFPYAPAPVSRPAYGVEEDEDDAASINTDSTLVSDGDISSSLQHTRRQSSISTSPADSHNSVSQQLPFPTLSIADLPTPPTSGLTIESVDTIQKSHLDWNADAAASRDIETVFQKMLHKKFGIHSQPSEFIPDVIQHVFGNVEKSSYHLKLAPKDAHKEFGTEANGLGSLERNSPETKKSSRSKWFHPGPDKEEKKRTKKISKPSTPISTRTSSPALDTPIPEGLNGKAAGRLGITSDMTVSISRVPENVSAKAAHKLGIPMSSERATEIPIPSCKTIMSPDTSDDTPFPSPSPSPAPTPAPAPSTAPTPAPAPSSPEDNRQSIISFSASSGDSKLSAKAANRLGISYSELGEATALAKASTRRPVSSSSTLVTGPTAPVQSPGLIVWPNRFIPMSPEELEMHALKNVHMLVGCKPALMEFIGTFLDEDGKRIASDEDFEANLWHYECFRRRRLNWPADIPSDWEADADVDDPESTSAPTSKPGADTPASAKSATPRNQTPLSSLPESASSPLDKIDELTHVRTIRVFEAVKAEEYTLSTMKNPRSPPPSPQR
ncbi:hypothetical protein C0995_015139 [Termitomyces sp. Mi166|nr:hypothetical protein C0995_015139 [Termitomyces sp. Mi166\